jgi:hypothetical protein
MKLLITILGLFSFVLGAAQNGETGFVTRVGNKGIVKPLSVEYATNPEHHGTTEAGTIISICRSPAHVIGARFSVNHINLKDTSVFSLMMYEVKDGVPTNNILFGPLIVAGKIEKGMLSVDLAEYNIHVNEDFFLALRWTGEKGQLKISFGSGMNGEKSFHRDDDEPWETLPIMKLAFSATIETEKDLPCTVNVWKLTAFNPGVAFERKGIRENQTLYMHYYAATSFGLNFSSSNGTNSFLTFDPAATLQYRFYYNGKIRSQRGKRTALNSMNYISPSLDLILTRASISQDYLVPEQRRPLIVNSVLWGMQRNYPRRFSLDFNIGPAFYLAKVLQMNGNETVEQKMTSGFTVVSNLTIGWWLNSRR